MFNVIIVVCSLKSMCIPSFVLIGCCVSELRGHLYPYCNVWPEGILLPARLGSECITVVAPGVAMDYIISAIYYIHMMCEYSLLMRA